MDEQLGNDSEEAGVEAGPDTAAVEADVFLDIEAEPDQVWEALTTEGGLAPWMGEGATVDPTPGGLVALPDPVGGATRRGRVERVERANDGSRLDFTWWPALRPAERTSVSITVAPTEQGCRVRVIERPIAARATASRLPVGLWSWRLAVLSLSSCLSRI
jgi:uncharacterized protein YndB with AHSA1/START domain